MINAVVSNDPAFFLDTVPIIVMAFVTMILLGVREVIGIFKRRKARKEAQK
jgi:hypothetical protein